jgi:hypothetical protein
MKEQKSIHVWSPDTSLQFQHNLATMRRRDYAQLAAIGAN